MDNTFGAIQETALITVAIRASESARPKPRIVDKKAQELIDHLGVDVSRFDKFLSHEGVVARTIMFRDRLNTLLHQYPDAVVINLGCGFDDKFSQVDNGRIRWFDVDLPDQIAMRRHIFSDSDRCVMLSGSALSSDWIAHIPQNQHVIVVMEGVLQYFSKEQVQTCLRLLCDHFERGYLLGELHSPFLSKHGRKHDTVRYTNAHFGWGTKSGEELIALEPRMTLLSEVSLNEEMKKHTVRGRLFALVGKHLNNRVVLFEW